MKRAKVLAFAACLMASVGFCGCQTMTTTARGQSPDGDIHPVGHHYHQPIKAAKSAVQDCYHEHNNTTTTHYNASQSCQTGTCPSGGCPSGNCPPGGGSAYDSGICQNGCPPGRCPTGRCGNGHGNEWNHYPRHGFSYSYERPNDLAYPAQGSVGGAVVYPYYTHRGPSDFFRK